MYVLLSGEGPTDLGSAAGTALVCEGENYLHGPMAVIVDQIVEDRYAYSPIVTGACGFVSEGQLAAAAGELKAVRKEVRLPGKKWGKETRYFFNSARTFAPSAAGSRSARAYSVPIAFASPSS